MKRRTFVGTTATALAAPRIVSAQGRASVVRYVPQSDLAILDPV